MEGCRDKTPSKVEIEGRLAALNRLHRRLERRKEQFRDLEEDALAAKIDNIRRLLNSIDLSAPAAISHYRAVLPQYSGRRRPRRGNAPQLRSPPYP
jgi:hypothetical protein